MAIWGFFGSLGSGKDTTANFFLNRKIQKTGKQVISHCKLDFPYIYMTIDDIFNKAITETEFFYNKILYISEFQLIMESRRSSASVNVDFSQNILIQLSKLDCDFFYTCQLLSQIDLRIKEMQKYFFFCQKEFRTQGLEQNVIFRGEMVPLYSIIDWDSRIVKNPINDEIIPFDIDINYLERSGQSFIQEKVTLPFESILPMFSRFDTREIVKFNRSKYSK